MLFLLSVNELKAKGGCLVRLPLLHPGFAPENCPIYCTEICAQLEYQDVRWMTGKGLWRYPTVYRVRLPKPQLIFAPLGSF